MGGHRDPHSAAVRPPPSPGSRRACAPAVLGSLAGPVSDRGRVCRGRVWGQAAGSRAVPLWVCLICPLPHPTSHCPPPPVPGGDPPPRPPAAFPLSVWVPPRRGSHVLCPSACLFSLVLVSVCGCLFHSLNPQAPWACLTTPPGPLLSAGGSQTGRSSTCLLRAGKPQRWPEPRRNGPELGGLEPRGSWGSAQGGRGYPLALVRLSTHRPMGAPLATCDRFRFYYTREPVLRRRCSGSRQRADRWVVMSSVRLGTCPQAVLGPSGASVYAGSFEGSKAVWGVGQS